MRLRVQLRRVLPLMILAAVFTFHSTTIIADEVPNPFPPQQDPAPPFTPEPNTPAEPPKAPDPKNPPQPAPAPAPDPANQPTDPTQPPKDPAKPPTNPPTEPEEPVDIPMHGRQQVNCNEAYKDLGNIPKSRGVEYLRLGKHFPTWKIPVWRARNYFLVKMRQWMRRAYPIMAYDNGAPFKANYIARSYLDRLTEAEKASNPFDVDAIKKEFDALVKQTKEFPERMGKLVDEELETSAQMLAVEDEIKQIRANPKYKGNPNPHGPFMLELPFVKDNKITTALQQFNDVGQIRAKLSELRSRHNEIMSKTPEMKTSFLRSAYEQALNIKVLETYRAELSNEFHRIPGDLPKGENAKKIADMVKEIDGLVYSDESKKYMPPNEAFQRLQWVQVQRELKEFKYNRNSAAGGSSIGQDLPGGPNQPGGDPTQNLLVRVGNFFGHLFIRPKPPGTDPKNAKPGEYQKVMDWFNHLTPDQVAGLGVGRVGNYVNTVRNSGWVMAVTSGVGYFGSGQIDPIYFFFWGVENFVLSGDAGRKRRCVAMDDDSAYVKCSLDYVKQKFPLAHIQQIELGKNMFIVTDKDGNNVPNPDIQKELDDIAEKRNKELARRNVTQDIDAILAKKLSEKNPDSPDWHKKWVAAGVKERGKVADSGGWGTNNGLPDTPNGDGTNPDPFNIGTGPTGTTGTTGPTGTANPAGNIKKKGSQVASNGTTGTTGATGGSGDLQPVNRPRTTELTHAYFANKYKYSYSPAVRAKVEEVFKIPEWGSDAMMQLIYDVTELNPDIGGVLQNYVNEVTTAGRLGPMWGGGGTWGGWSNTGNSGTFGNGGDWWNTSNTPGPFSKLKQ